MNTHALVGLALDFPWISPAAPNFVPGQWPPADDFPVSVDAKGRVISRYSDHIWDLTPWSRKTLKINFGDGPRKGKGLPISKDNADTLRAIDAWWLWGPHSVQTSSELYKRHELLRPLFILCSREGMSATMLMRFPLVLDQVPSCITSSRKKDFLRLLHDIWDCRDQLGFVILDPNGIRQLAATVPDHEKAQTPYIPPRIWQYQVSRLRECLEDFHSHRSKIEAFYKFCLDAYATNAGSLENASLRQLIKGREPFKKVYNSTGERTGCRFHGSFLENAQQYGLADLLVRWTDIEEPTIQTLSSYFTLIAYVGTAYILNFSMMRVEEAWSLRNNCLSTERDPVGDDISILRGPTTKTIHDNDACWITSPSIRVAIEAMECVARLRLIAAASNPNVPISREDELHPHLTVRAYEPWSGRIGDISQPLSVRPAYRSYALFIEQFPKLFDAECLKITQADLDAALLLTPTLDPDRFALNKPWPFAWHQLRRTGAVNMCASGIVGDSSVQYQLKHATRAMSRYYGQGYYHLQFGLNQEVRGEYIRTMYETIAREFALLGSERFVSPYGDDHKSAIINLVSDKEHISLVAAAKKQSIAYRQHLLGGCTNPDPCDKGGVESVAPCGGDGKPCEHLLYDREKLPDYLKLSELLAIRQGSAPPGSPLAKSLSSQMIAVSNAIASCTE